jgi:hypothetical protein
MIRRQWVLLLSAFVVATLFLALTSLGSAAAAGPAGHGYAHGLVGTVKGDPAPAASSFVLTLKRKGGDPTGDVTINVVETTKFKIPGDKSVNSTNYNFADGDRVTVLGELVSGATYKALHVHLILAKGPKQHVGTILAGYDLDGGAGNITIQPKKGGTVAYSWGAAAAPKITFKKGATSPYDNGERATVILKRNPVTCGFDVNQIVVVRAKGKP